MASSAVNPLKWTVDLVWLGNAVSVHGCTGHTLCEKSWCVPMSYGIMKLLHDHALSDRAVCGCNERYANPGMLYQGVYRCHNFINARACSCTVFPGGAKNSMRECRGMSQVCTMCTIHYRWAPVLCPCALLWFLFKQLSARTLDCCAKGLSATRSHSQAVPAMSWAPTGASYACTFIN